MTELAYFTNTVSQIETRFSENLEKGVKNDMGFFEGYAVTFDTVDSYNSTFKRGCFSETLEKRAKKIKLLFNHENGFGQKPLTIIGTIPEIKEDEKGLYVRGHLALDIEKGREVYSLMRSGAINTLSFGFIPIEERDENGVRVITKVDLFEISPVGFEANPTAQINQVRAEQKNLNMNLQDDLTQVKTNNAELNESKKTDEPIEQRDVSTTFKEKLLNDSRDSLIVNLQDTLIQLWWEYASNMRNGESLISDVQNILTAFTKEYLNATKQTVALADGGMRNALPINDGIPQKLLDYLTSTKQTMSDLAMNSELTLNDVRCLSRGDLIPNADRLKDVDTDLMHVHKSEHDAQLQRAIAKLKNLANRNDFSTIRSNFEISEIPIKKDNAVSMLNQLLTLNKERG